ncbi:DsbA family oxidoreductase [Georgenia thermotolerans]|uniref:Thioredoxin domain-containing protein n=1 Tax=Georgenia thermotolerans TaxID=527326 RepID=A0A7J5UIU2_9MICO|nr:DsbA family oxidoreductase [Georgenia thermotolerans]KAE8762305.1 thioredoxin domain-containing protein [Georgenia thermotolerans]
MSQPISVHVWSDIACPWCFIGKRRFEKAAAAFDGEVEVVYHSFELAPDTPVDFEGSEVDFLADHKGMPREQVAQMLGQMTQLAAAEGLAYDFDKVQHTKTLKAHELLHHAKTQGRQLEVAERLFSAYFEQGRHVGHEEDLVALAVEAGLDAEETRRVLADGTYRADVQADITAARQLGIQGVPFYVVGEKYGVSGAQSPEVFAEALRRAAAERDADEPAGQGAR